MPLVYGLSLATAGSTTSNGTTATENETFFVKAGVRNARLISMLVAGRGNARTTISGLIHRLLTWGTASTSGTAITPRPRDPGAQAAKATAASGPTAGSTRLNHIVFGCGAAGPGGWQARDEDDKLTLEGGGALSIDGTNIAGDTSLPFDWSAVMDE